MSNRKTMNCKLCDEPVENVGIEATSVTCSSCVNRMVSSCPPSNED